MTTSGDSRTAVVSLSSWCEGDFEREKKRHRKEETVNPIYVDAGKLDLNQRAVYDLKLEAKFIVQGCAGSGKTSLALLRMKQLLAKESADGETPFYYVTFVRELVECMRREINGSNMRARFNDYAITYYNWEQGSISGRQCRRFGIRARAAMGSGGIVVNRKPDYLFVDECQDLVVDAIESLMQGAQKGIGFYGDDSQHIMNWTERHPVTLETIHDRFHLPIHELVFNYRLPKEIALFAEQLGGRPDLSRHCKSPYHEKPFLIRVKDSTEACNFMQKRIVNSGLQDVGVAYARNEDAKAAYQSLATHCGSDRVSVSYNIGGFGGGDYSYLKDTPVKVMTYHKIKGQQFETVFLFVSGELSPEQVKRLYVGVTRAERFLYILYTDPMPSVLRQIPLCLYNTTDALCDFKDLYQRPTGLSEPRPAMPRRSPVVDVGF